MADRSRQLGEKFTLQGASWTSCSRPDMIPVSLIRWEMTGQRPLVAMP